MKNKKIMVLLGSLAVFLLVFIIANSVSESEGLVADENQDLYIAEYEEEVEELYVSQIQQIRASFPPASEVVHLNEIFAHLTQEDFLYDLEYLMYVLNNNFSHMIILEERGFDINQMAENAIEKILANENISIAYFWDVLWYDFFEYIRGIGHLEKLGIGHYRNAVESNIAPGGIFRSGQAFIARPLILNPNTLLLYGDILSLTENPPFVTGRNILVNRYATNIPIRTHPRNLNTRILEEDRIAYMQIVAFTGDISSIDRTTIRDFYEEIEDFEHLIIDLRGNLGGSMVYFFSLIMAPLINEDLSHTFFYFHKDGQHVINRKTRAYARGPAGANPAFPLASTRLPASEEIIATIPESNRWAIEYFDYFGTATFRVRRNDAVTGSSNFDGEIWLLVDNYAFSAPQLAASFVYETDFATIVGQTTGGMIGGATSMIFFSLPNTGIIISFDYGLMLDSNGRPLENGTIPHIYSNNPLATVLELIGQ